MISLLEETKMTPSRIFLPACLLAPLALVVASGCSSKTNPTSRVAVYTEFGNGTHSQDECRLGPKVQWASIGQLGPNRQPGDPTVPVNDGDAWQGHSVHIQACSVIADGNGFQVNVSATIEGAEGGTVSFNGKFLPAQDNASIMGVFSRQDTGQFVDPACTAKFDRPEMGVKAGAVWASLDCPNAANKGQNRVCAGSAEIRFENCDQGGT